MPEGEEALRELLNYQVPHFISEEFKTILHVFVKEEKTIMQRLNDKTLLILMPMIYKEVE